MLPDPLPPGYVLQRYRIEAELRRGSSGRFYKAVDTGSQATVAINIPDPSLRTPEGQARFFFAVRKAAKSGDKRLLDLGVWEKVYYVTVTYDGDDTALLDLAAAAAAW